MRVLRGAVAAARGAVVAAALAGLAAAAARADDYAPFLQDLRAAVIARDEALPEPATREERREVAAVRRARAVLERLEASATWSIRGDLEALGLAARALRRGVSADDVLARQVRAAFELYHRALEALESGLRRLAGDRPPQVRGEASRRIVGVSISLVRARLAGESPLRAARWIAAAAENVEAAAEVIGMPGGMRFVHGSIEAKVDGVPRRFRFAHAFWDETPPGYGEGGPSRIGFSAFDPEGGLWLDCWGLPEVGGVVDARTLACGEFLPSPSVLGPRDGDEGSEFLAIEPGSASTMTFEEFEPALGRASGSVVLHLLRGEGAEPILLEGTFDIDRGMAIW